VALAQAVSAIPRPDALPGGCLYEPKWDGYLHCTCERADKASLHQVRAFSATPGLGSVTQARLDLKLGVSGADCCVRNLLLCPPNTSIVALDWSGLS
jgi:hypothetical protein